MKVLDERKNTLHASIGPMEQMPEGPQVCRVTVSYNVLVQDAVEALGRLLATAGLKGPK